MVQADQFLWLAQCTKLVIAYTFIWWLYKIDFCVLHSSFFLSFFNTLSSLNNHKKPNLYTHNMSTDKLIIFDTTLRDGEQVTMQMNGIPNWVHQCWLSLVSWCHFKHRGKDWDCKDTLSSWCRCPWSWFPYCFSRWFWSSTTYCKWSRSNDGGQRKDWSSYGKCFKRAAHDAIDNLTLSIR